jgi:hypothetical protein
VRGEAYTGFRWGNLREIDHLGHPGIDWKIILRWILYPYFAKTTRKTPPHTIVEHSLLYLLGLSELIHLSALPTRTPTQFNLLSTEAQADS